MQIHCLEVGTCSDRALQLFLIKNRGLDIGNGIIRAESFECCKANCECITGSLLLVPHVHPIAGLLSLAASWSLLSDKVFALENPPLYLASLKRTQTANLRGKTCATLATLVPLLDKELGLEIILAENTQNAARQVISAEAECCVTNQHGILTYGLNPLVELKKFDVIWMPFVYQSNKDKF